MMEIILDESFKTSFKRSISPAIIVSFIHLFYRCLLIIVFMAHI